MSYASIYSEAPHRQPAAQTENANSPTRTRTRRTARFSGLSARKNSALEYPILVHSHLSWDWVWQRPQQFISRLSRKHKVLFIETAAPDPELAAPMARFRRLGDYPNLTVLRLQFPAWCWQDGKKIDGDRRRLVQEFLAGPVAGEYPSPVQWFYDPMAVPAFLGQMGEILTVYDCMDELSKFACAPPEIVQRERELLARAEVVFTGGRRLLESKSRFNSNCHFYGCGVDHEHFGKACAAETEVPADVATLPQPVLGYFGVIDERLDYDLIAALADANPAWSIAMVGPVLKVEDSRLPRRPNLHWLGKRDYAELPALCRGFSLCLMPFALNESTQYINPTKALEYMAAGRQVISSAVPDVERNFGAVAKVARSPEEFIHLCQKAVERPDPAAIGRGLEMARANSWDSIVNALENHVHQALLHKRKTNKVT